MFLKAAAKFKSLLSSRKGQGLAEYGLIIALVAIVVIAAITTMGENLTGVFEKIADSLSV